MKGNHLQWLSHMSYPCTGIANLINHHCQLVSRIDSGRGESTGRNSRYRSFSSKHSSEREAEVHGVGDDRLEP